MRLLVCAPTALLLLAAPAQAGLRCDHDLVQEGESAARLLQVCGEPTLRQTIAVDNTSTSEGIVEQWTYDLGPGTLLQIVTIEAGKVAKIEDGERR
jgi:hypothetical protein